MAVVYKSKIDWWLAVIILSALAVSAWASVKLVLTCIPFLWCIAFLTVGIGVGLPLWVLLGTYYRIDSGHLHIKSGPFKRTLTLADITRITPTSDPLSSPALSLDRLRIDYGHGSSIMISPRNKEQFIQEIQALRS